MKVELTACDYTSGAVYHRAHYLLTPSGGNKAAHACREHQHMYIQLMLESMGCLIVVISALPEEKTDGR